MFGQVDYSQFGTGGAVGVALVVILLLVKHLVGRNGRSVEADRWKDLFRLVRQIHQWDGDLHEWHSVSDAEGVKVWYVRRSLEEAIVKLAENIDKQTEILRQMHAELMTLQREKMKE